MALGLLGGMLAGAGQAVQQNAQSRIQERHDKAMLEMAQKYQTSERKADERFTSIENAETRRHSRETAELSANQVMPTSGGGLLLVNPMTKEVGAMDLPPGVNLGSDDLSGREEAILEGLDSRLATLTTRYYDSEVMWGEGQREDLYEEIQELEEQRARLTGSSADPDVFSAHEGLSGGGQGDGSVDSIWQNIIQAESNGQQFDADGKPLTSSAGAIGIAQVMPGTAPEAARMAGLEWDENRYRTDANYNEALGRAYFENQVEKYQDPVLAVAAYNAGPGNVDKWVKEYGDPRKGEISHEDFVRQIPFAETQGYVLKTLGGSSGAPSIPGIGSAQADDTPSAQDTIQQEAEEKVSKLESKEQKREIQKIAKEGKSIASSLQNSRDMTGAHPRHEQISTGTRGSDWAEKRRALMEQGKAQMQELVRAQEMATTDAQKDLIEESMRALFQAGVPLPKQ